MKYRMEFSKSNTIVEVFTDHQRPVPLEVFGDNLSAGGLAGAIVYCYTNITWTHAGAARLFTWLHCIDETATFGDITEIARLTMEPADLLLFYAELNKIGVSHLDL